MPITDSVKALMQGLEIVEQAMNKKRWTKTETPDWWESADISQATLKRFWSRQPIRRDNFIEICEAVGVHNWEEIVDTGPTPYPTPVVHGWVGRGKLIAELSAKLQGDCRVLMITGITGIGKTALAERLAVETQGTWTKSDRVDFDRQPATDFVRVAETLLVGWDETVTPAERQEPMLLLNRLVKRLKENRYLVAINSLERILKGDTDKGWTEFEDPLWESFFSRLLSADACQSWVILTSQDLPRDLERLGRDYQNFWHHQSLGGFTKEEGLAFFATTGLEVAEKSENRPVLEQIWELFEGHPLALKVIAGEIKNRPFDGNGVKYWQMYGQKLEVIKQKYEQDAVKQGADLPKLHRLSRPLRRMLEYNLDDTFSRLAKQFFDAYLLLCHSAVYNVPVPEEAWLMQLEVLGRDEEQQEAALDALYARFLVELEPTEEEDLLRQHYLIRSKALECLKKTITTKGCGHAEVA